MTIYALDSLEPIERRKPDKQYFLSQLTHRNRGTEKLIRDDMSDSADIYHTNYPSYLETCWRYHMIPVLSPDIIWHTILCQFAALIKLDPDRYAFLFTKFPGTKQTISVPTGDAEYLPVEAIVQELRRRIPIVDDYNTFMLDFTTSTDRSRRAFGSAFADICSPYYNYTTFACGFPAIDFRGTYMDYVAMHHAVAQLKLLLMRHLDNVSDDKLYRYLSDKLHPLTKTFCAIAITSDKTKITNFLRSMFIPKKCGSGSQFELSGWWVSSMYAKSFVGERAENLPSSLARVEWTNAETNRKFAMYSGLLYSAKDEAGVMVPEWGEFTTELGTYAIEEKSTDL